MVLLGTFIKVSGIFSFPLPQEFIEIYGCNVATFFQKRKPFINYICYTNVISINKAISANQKYSGLPEENESLVLFALLFFILLFLMKKL